MQAQDSCHRVGVIMICLTGDVHHASLNTKGQKYLPLKKTEAVLARRYLEIAEAYKVKVTLFMTGRLFLEEWNSIRELLKYDNLEIGGHSFNAFQSKLLHLGVFKFFTGSAWGPRFYQKWEIIKTIQIIKERTGSSILSWRNHAFIHDKNTYEILNKCGIRIISDEIKRDAFFPYIVHENLISLPINTLIDHNHIFHAYRSPAYVAKEKWTGDDFGNQSYNIEEWGILVQNQIRNIVERKGIATILAHPICMYLSDKFKTFEALCKFISSFQTIFAKDVLELNLLKTPGIP